MADAAGATTLLDYGAPSAAAGAQRGAVASLVAHLSNTVIAQRVSIGGDAPAALALARAPL